MATTIVGECRFSFVNVFEPRDQFGAGKEKYSITMLIPKTNKKLVDKIRSDMNAALKAGQDKKFNGTLPKNPKIPLYDGDGQRPNGEDFGPECKGMYVLTATTGADYPPQIVVGNDRHPCMDHSEVYSGAWGYVSVNFSAYNYNGQKGVGCYLGNVWKTRDDEALAGRKTTADEDFGDIVLSDASDDSLGIDY